MAVRGGGCGDAAPNLGTGVYHYSTLLTPKHITTRTITLQPEARISDEFQVYTGISPNNHHVATCHLHVPLIGFHRPPKLASLGIPASLEQKAGTPRPPRQWLKSPASWVGRYLGRYLGR